MKNIREYLTKKGLEWKNIGNNEILLNMCPFCFDQKSHFYTNEK